MHRDDGQRQVGQFPLGRTPGHRCRHTDPHAGTPRRHQAGGATVPVAQFQPGALARGSRHQTQAQPFRHVGLPHREHRELDVQGVVRAAVIGDRHVVESGPPTIPGPRHSRVEPLPTGLPCGYGGRFGGSQPGVERGMVRSADQSGDGQRSRGRLQGRGATERPTTGRHRTPAPDLGAQRHPTREAVFTGQRQLRDRQGHPIRHGTKSSKGSRLRVERGTQQLACLAAHLVKVGTIGQFRHDASSSPRFACGRVRRRFSQRTPGSTRRWTQVLPANPAAPSHAVTRAYTTTSPHAGPRIRSPDPF